MGSSWPFRAHLAANFAPKLLPTAPSTPVRPASNHFANCRKPRCCQRFDGNADRNDKYSKEPMHQPTSIRSRSGGMRGAIRSAATVYGEHGRAKLLVRILSDSFQFLKGTKTTQAHSAGQSIVCHRLPSLAIAAVEHRNAIFVRPHRAKRTCGVQIFWQDPRLSKMIAKIPKMAPKMTSRWPKLVPSRPQDAQDDP